MQTWQGTGGVERAATKGLQNSDSPTWTAAKGLRDADWGIWTCAKGFRYSGWGLRTAAKGLRDWCWGAGLRAQLKSTFGLPFTCKHLWSLWTPVWASLTCGLGNQTRPTFTIGQICTTAAQAKMRLPTWLCRLRVTTGGFAVCPSPRSSFCGKYCKTKFYQIRLV